jgi:nucleotide-binding universal stress UspA family protein
MTAKILVGIDGSSPSRAAVRWAVTRAAATASAVTLVQVLDDEWGIIGAEMLAEVERGAIRLVDAEADYARSLIPGVPIAVTRLRGDPMIELAIASLDAELVVVGTHKTGFLHGRAFGSRSLQLAASAHSPVAVIPEAFSSLGHGVVVGIDDSSASHAALAFGADEAERGGQELVLVRAWKLPDLHGDHTGALSAAEARQQASAERLMMDAVTAVHASHPALVVRCRSMRRAAAEALVDASTTANLLVIGSSRRHGVEQNALGSVSHDVLLNLAIPTLIVHGDDRAEVGTKVQVPVSEEKYSGSELHDVSEWTSS